MCSSHLFFACSLLLLFSLSSPVRGQKNEEVNLKLFETSQGSPVLIEQLSFSDTTQLAKFVQKKTVELVSEGFILAGVDSVKKDGKAVNTYIYKGAKYRWITLNAGDIPVEYFKDKYQKKIESGKPIDPTGLQEIFEFVLTRSEDNGYPFAQIFIDQPEISERGISGRIGFEPGPLIYYDSIQIVSSAPFVKRSYLEDLLQVKPGQTYSESLNKGMENRLSNQGFIKLNRSPEFYFYRNKVQPGLDISRRKNSTFDLLIGFMPNATVDNKLLITGLADINLTNLFRSGKELELHWERLQVETQSLVLNYRHPYLLHSPVSMNGGVDIYKQDSTFITRQFLISAGYDVGLYTSVNLSGTFESSNLTRDPSQDISEIATGELLYNDFKVNYFGLSVDYSKVERENLIPRSGWEFGVDGKLGYKKIERDESLDQQLYEGISLNSLQIRVVGNLDWHGMISSRSNILISGSVGILENEQLFVNDLFRLGGINNLRGFNENEFYASDYLKYTVEYRLIFNRFSFIYAFFDQAFITNAVLGGVNDNPYGFGSGIQLLTNNSGRLNLAYALGGRNGQRPDFSLSKIHIGYKVLF